MGLTVKRTEELRVPGPAGLHAGRISLALVRLLCVDEVVRVPVVENLADDEGAFPRGSQLVLAGCPLDEPEHEVALAEREGFDLLAVVVAQALLVDGGPAKGQEACLLEQVDAVFARLFCFGFGVHRDPG